MAMEQQLFDKDSRRKAKLDAIIRTASALISRGGAGTVSLDDVARELGVTKPTLYHYVNGKKELLALCLLRILDEKEAIIARADEQGGTGREKLELFFRNYARFAWSEASGMPALIVTSEISLDTRLDFNRRNLELVRRTRAFMREGERDGTLRVDRADLLENFIVGTILWGSVSFLQRDQNIDVDDVVTHYLRFLMDGVGAK